MSTVVRFSCPGCQMTLQSDPAQVGVIVSCPRCKRQMKVPSPTDSEVKDAVLSAETSSDLAVQWYYVKNQQQHGPMSLNQLNQLAAAGDLESMDMVWRKGMAEWTVAHAVQELGRAIWASRPMSDAEPPHVPSNKERDAFDVELEFEVVSPPSAALVESAESGVIQGIPVEALADPLSESRGRRAENQGEPDRAAKPRKHSRPSSGGTTMLVSSGGISEEYETLGLLTAFASSSDGILMSVSGKNVYQTALDDLIGKAKKQGADGLLFVNFQVVHYMTEALTKSFKRTYEVFAWGTAVKIG